MRGREPLSRVVLLPQFYVEGWAYGGVVSSSSGASSRTSTVYFGYGHVAGSGAMHALLWTGKASTAVGLQQYLPNTFTSSEAYAIDKAGTILGSAYSTTTGSFHAVEWIP